VVFTEVDMTLKEFRQMAQRYWVENGTSLPIPGEARVITGNPNNDAFFYYMMADNGVEMILVPEQRPAGGCQWHLTDFAVIDEQKFTMFVLRWA
jgi:hypothetical protein